MLRLGRVGQQVAAVVTAASAANFSAREVASAAAAATRALGSAASTTAPLQGLARSVERLGHVGAEAQAAVVAAAGAVWGASTVN